jgi:hypothetical protein
VSHLGERFVENLFIGAAAGLTNDAAMTVAHRDRVRADGLLAADDELLVWWCATEPDREVLSGLWERSELPDAARRELIRRLPHAACEAAVAGDAEALEVAADLPRRVFRAAIADLGDDFGALAALVARRCELRDLDLLAGSADAEVSHIVASRITGTSLSDVPRLRAKTFNIMYRLTARDWPACVDDALARWLAKHRHDAADPALLGQSDWLSGTIDLAEASLSSTGPDEIVDIVVKHPGLYLYTVSEIVAAGARRARARGDRPAAGTWLALSLVAEGRSRRRVGIDIDDEGIAELALAHESVLPMAGSTMSEGDLCRLAAIAIDRPAVRTILMQRIFSCSDDVIRTLWDLLDEDARAEALASSYLREAYSVGIISFDDLFTAGPARRALVAVSGDDEARLANAIAARLDYRPDAFDVLVTLDVNVLTLAEACDAALAAVRRPKDEGPVSAT